MPTDYLPWNASEFACSSDKCRKRFPPPQLGLLDEPAIVVDSDGHIVIWYLPGLLLGPRQAELINATEHISTSMAKNIKYTDRRKRAQAENPEPNVLINWRVDEKYFRSSSPSQCFPAGIANYSAGWLAQGHTTAQFSLKPSCSLRGKEAQEWMKDSAEGVKLVNRAMELIHPHLFACSTACRNELRTLPKTKELASKWESAFTAITVISNRVTKEHKDSGGEPGWYDFLLSLGNYSSTAIVFEELGLKLMYNPGAAVAFCANVFRHRVGDWGRGDRICYAFYNKKSVLQRFGLDKAGWMTTDKLKMEA